MKKFVSLIFAVVLAMVSSVAFAQNYLTFKALENSSVTILNSGSSNPDVQYSFDGNTWNSFVSGKAVPIGAFQSMYVKGNNAAGFSSSESDYTSFVMNGKISASGSVMSLIDQTGESTVIPNKCCFLSLFNGCEALISAPELPATTLTEKCYYMMFMGCGQLAVAPNLPAKTLEKECYTGMFFNTNIQKMNVGFSNWNSEGNSTYSFIYNIYDCLRGVIYCPTNLEINRNEGNGGHYIPPLWMVNPHKVSIEEKCEEYVTLAKSSYADNYPQIDDTYTVDRTTSTFTSEEKQIANTAKDCDYLTNVEIEMIQLLNLVRMDGVKFTNEYLSDLVGSDNTYESSLIDDLKKVRDLPLLYPNKSLYEAALYHNKEMAEMNSLQHESPDGSTPGDRVDTFYNWGTIAENIAYYPQETSAFNILKGYLIDEQSISDELYGHRYNIIRSNKCTRIGFSVYYDERNNKYWNTQDFADANDDYSWAFKDTYSQEETVTFTIADRTNEGATLEKVLLNETEISTENYSVSFSMKDFTSDVVISVVYSDTPTQCDNIKQKTISVYPNPAKANSDIYVTIAQSTEIDNGSLTIFDDNGTAVKTISHVSANTKFTLQSGIYFGVLQNNTHKKTFKLIVE